MDTPEQRQEQFKKFTEEVLKICNQFNIILEKDHESLYKSNKKPPVAIRVTNFLNSFIKLTKNSDCCEQSNKTFLRCFTMWGNLHRSELLHTVSSENGMIKLNDDWLLNENIVIDLRTSLKDLTPEESKIMAQRVLEISTIYKCAMKLQVTNSDLLENNQDIEEIDLKRRHIIILHLLRIYYYLSDIATKRVLSVSINDLEVELGMTKNVYEQDKIKKGGGIINRFFNTASKIMGNDSFSNVTENIDEDKIMDVFEKIINNEETTKVVKDITQSTKDCKNFKDVITTLASEITKEETINLVRGEIDKVVSNVTDMMAGEQVPATPNEQEVDL